MRRVTLFIIAWVICFSLITSTNAETIEEKAVISKGDSRRCEYHTYYIKDKKKTATFGYNFSTLKLGYVNKFNLNNVTHFGIVDRECDQMVVGLKRKNITGHHSCFSLTFGKKGTYRICPSRKSFSKAYFLILNTLRKLGKVTSSQFKQHRQLMVFKQYYRIFETAPFRSKKEHQAEAVTRDVKVNYDEWRKKQYFSIGERIGSGGGGMVFECTRWDAKTNKEIGPCVSKSTRLIIGQDWGPDTAKGLIRETKLLFMMKGHPNILEFYGAFADQNGLNIFLERLTGDLKELQMEKGKPVRFTKAEDLYRIAIEMLIGINYMHRQGFYHFDIKPENVMMSINKDGRYITKIIDFGLTRSRIFQTEEDFFKLPRYDGGTIHYFSHERISGDKRSCDDTDCLVLQDVYAAGLTILDALVASQGEGKELIREFNEFRYKANKNSIQTYYQDRIPMKSMQAALKAKRIDGLANVAVQMIAVDEDKRIDIETAIRKLRILKAKLPPAIPSKEGRKPMKKKEPKKQ